MLRHRTQYHRKRNAQQEEGTDPSTSWSWVTQSGEDNGSSQAMQAEFVRQTFQAWDAHQDQVKLVSFTWLTDIDPVAVKGYERYYGVSSKGFASYLGTLGLRTYDGEDKDAFRALNDETKRRGW